MKRTFFPQTPDFEKAIDAAARAASKTGEEPIQLWTRQVSGRMLLLSALVTARGPRSVGRLASDRERNTGRSAATVHPDRR